MNLLPGHESSDDGSAAASDADAAHPQAPGCGEVTTEAELEQLEDLHSRPKDLPPCSGELVVGSTPHNHMKEQGEKRSTAPDSWDGFRGVDGKSTIIHPPCAEDIGTLIAEHIGTARSHDGLGRVSRMRLCQSSYTP